MINEYYDSLSRKFEADDLMFSRAMEFFSKLSKSKSEKFPSTIKFLIAMDIRPAQIAEKAWVFFKKAMKEHGGKRNISFGSLRRHRAIHATIKRCGGWAFLCSCNEPDVDEIEGKFKEVFIDIFVNDDLNESTYLPGLYEFKKGRKELFDLSTNKVKLLDVGSAKRIK
jgi:hypothetical protein